MTSAILETNAKTLMNVNSIILKKHKLALVSLNSKKVKRILLANLGQTAKINFKASAFSTMIWYLPIQPETKNVSLEQHVNI